MCRCGQCNEFHYVGLSDRRPCVLLLLRWHYMKFLALLSCQCCPLSSSPAATPLSLPFFPSAQATPKLTCKILTHALRGRGLLLCLCLAKCVIPRLARQLGSSLARLTASSNPNECSSLSVWCETRAFCLGPYLDWPSILCKNIFPKKKGCPWQRNCVNNT